MTANYRVFVQADQLFTPATCTHALSTINNLPRGTALVQ